VTAVLPRIVAEHPEVVYVVVGAIHPHIRPCEGDQYRIPSQTLALDNQSFVAQTELCKKG
jgi:hypothetical protein